MIRGRIKNAHPPIRYHAMQGKSMATPIRGLVQGQAMRLADTIRAAMPIASGQLAGSLDVDIAPLGESTKASVSVDAPHAMAVLRGSRPHPVSGLRLLSWVMRRGGSRVPGRSPRQAAYAIAQKIAREGTPPHDFLTQPVREFRETLPAEVRRGIQGELRGWMVG